MDFNVSGALYFLGKEKYCVSLEQMTHKREGNAYTGHAYYTLDRVSESVCLWLYVHVVYVCVIVCVGVF